LIKGRVLGKEGSPSLPGGTGQSCQGGAQRRGYLGRGKGGKSAYSIPWWGGQDHQGEKSTPRTETRREKDLAGEAVTSVGHGVGKSRRPVR